MALPLTCIQSLLSNLKTILSGNIRKRDDFLVGRKWILAASSLRSDAGLHEYGLMDGTKNARAIFAFHVYH